MSLKNTVWKLPVRIMLKEIMAPKKIFVLLRSGDKSAAQIGEVNDMIVTIGPTNPMDVALAIKSLWGCEKFGKFAGRYGAIELNFWEIPYPSKGEFEIASKDAAHICSLNQMDSSCGPKSERVCIPLMIRSKYGVWIIEFKVKYVYIMVIRAILKKDKKVKILDFVK